MNLGCDLEAMVTTDGAVRPLPHVCQGYSVAICIIIQKRANQNTLSCRRPHRIVQSKETFGSSTAKYMRRGR